MFDLYEDDVCASWAEERVSVMESLLLQVLEEQQKNVDQQRQGYLDSQRQIEDILVYRKDRAKQAELQQQLEQVQC